MLNESLGIVIKEENVLEKFEDGILVERITIVDGEIVSQEVFGKEDS